MADIAPIYNYKNRIKLSEAVPLTTPFSIFVFPTTYCNFRCVYCAHALGAHEMHKRYGMREMHMNISLFKKIIEQIDAFPERLKLLSLTGQGEPMLNTYLPDMIRLAKDAHIADRIEIISNASLLTPELSMKLVDAGLDGIRISLQGLNSEKYYAVCQTSVVFENLYDNIRYFFEHRGTCEVLVKIMDIALESGEQETFYKLFDPICDRMYIETCRPVYCGVSFTDGFKSENIDRYGNYHEPRCVCPLCFYQLAVFPNGDVTPCDAIYQPVVLGNVTECTLYQMFHGKELRNFQRLQLSGKRFEQKGCAVCCAPDDVSHPLDELDSAAEELLHRMNCRDEL